MMTRRMSLLVVGLLATMAGTVWLGAESMLAAFALLLVVGGVAAITWQLVGLVEAAFGGTVRVPGGINERQQSLLYEVKRMSASSQWVAGVAMAVLALLGLFLLSRAEDGMFTVFALLLFVFGVGTIATLIHGATEYRQHDAATLSNEQEGARSEKVEGEA